MLAGTKEIEVTNGGGTLYCIVTTGEQWQMISYDCWICTQASLFQIVQLYGIQERVIDKRGLNNITDCIYERFRSSESWAVCFGLKVWLGSSYEGLVCGWLFKKS